jgi:hypothetical protein
MSPKFTVVTAAALLAMSGAAAHAQELIQNGGFETGSFSSWTPFGDTFFTGVWQGGPPNPHSGVFEGFFGTSGPDTTGGIQQVLTAIPGDQVHVSFWYVSEGGVTPNSLSVMLGSVQVFSTTDIQSTSWTQFSGDFTVADANPLLQFTFSNPFDYTDMDDVSVVLTGHTGGGCESADFDCDGDTGTDADIQAFFACLAGTCPAAPCTSTADFDGDGDVGTDADIEAFFRVLAGNPC